MVGDGRTTSSPTPPERLAVDEHSARPLGGGELVLDVPDYRIDGEQIGHVGDKW